MKREKIQRKGERDREREKEEIERE